MPIVADKTALQFKMLNTTKGQVSGHYVYKVIKKLIKDDERNPLNTEGINSD